MTDELGVWFQRERVGTLRRAGTTLRFAYDGSWRKSARGFPISISLPLEETEYSEPAHAFFANLLPEGQVREAVCRRFGVSYDNDFALLAAIGGECAGALALSASPIDDADDHEELTKARLNRLVADADAVPLLIGGARARLSLAGAQDKLPVIFDDGRLWLPLAGTPSTHILKLPSARFKHLVVNEAFVMLLARRMGLAVASADLWMKTAVPCLLVERWDRRRGEHGVERLHQEDMCQALGIQPSKKYEAEGGPTFAHVVDLVRRAVHRPLVDVPRLIQWQAFNAVVGNADGHAKNLALLYLPSGELELAPFYDIVSTRAYPRIHADLAMAIGGRANAEELHARQWRTLARELGVGDEAVLEMVGRTIDACLEDLEPAKKDFISRWGKHAVLTTLPEAIAKRARRARSNVRS